ncbi:MAG: ribonuclease M5 [Erysipelotrichaceae bacterium]|nr:ribonuclease M5 [Erysipelotrichaceae bacterium]
MIKELIVVEGKNDTKRLQSFFDVETIETHGLGLNRQTIELVKEANEKRGVILFLDPDTPGEKIRKKLNDEIPNLKNAFILKEDGRTSRKVGIEHASKEVLEEALNNLITYTDSKSSISMQEFYQLGLSGNDDSALRREKVYRHFHLGKCNGKTLFKRLNMLGIDKDEIEKIL